MEVLNEIESRKNLENVPDEIVGNHDVTIVSRSNNENVAILSLEDYNSWMETMHLLRSERNRTRLMDAVGGQQKEHFVGHDLMDE